MFVWMRTLNPDFERLHFFLIPQSQFLYCIYDNKVPTFIVHIQVLFFLIELQILNNPLFLKKSLVTSGSAQAEFYDLYCFRQLFQTGSPVLHQHVF